jgi:hypothetical protein
MMVQLRTKVESQGCGSGTTNAPAPFSNSSGLPSCPAGYARHQDPAAVNPLRGFFSSLAALRFRYGAIITATSSNAPPTERLARLVLGVLQQ